MSKNKAKNKKAIHEIDESNDIKYRGPLNYRHFRIAAWVILAVSQIGILIRLGNYLHPELAAPYLPAATALSVVGELITPLLLIANFSVILTARDGYRKLLIRFGGLTAALCILFRLFYERYFIGLLSLAFTREGAYSYVEAVLGAGEYLDFNVFLDLFLCTLVMFFLMYRPKRFFVGKKLIVFRLFAILPILYEAASIVIKILVSFDKMSVTPNWYPFFTTKPPLEFLLFVALALFIKRRERKFIKQGKTYEEYREFLATKTNSWHFAVHSAIIMAVAAVVDLVAAVVATLLIALPDYGTEAFSESATAAASTVTDWGLGQSVVMLAIAPLMLLYSYNRKVSHPERDIYIPIGGAILTLLVIIESLYQGVTMM